MLRDVMSSLNLTAYPIVAMSIFLAVFIAVAWRLFRSDKRDMQQRAIGMLGDTEPGQTTQTRESQ